MDPLKGPPMHGRDHKNGGQEWSSAELSLVENCLWSQRVRP